MQSCEGFPRIFGKVDCQVQNEFRERDPRTGGARREYFDNDFGVGQRGGLFGWIVFQKCRVVCNFRNDVC